LTVAHVHGAFVPSLTEGISANVHGLCAGLARAGVDARLEGVPVDLAGLNRRSSVAVAAWHAAEAARRAAERPGTRLVHVHAGLPLTAMAARRALRPGGPPVLAQVWNAHAEAGGRPAPVPRMDRLAHRVFNGPEAARLGVAGLPDLVVSSRHQERQLRRLGYAGNVHRVPNGVDTARFRPATPAEQEDARARLGVDGDPVILYYGHASSWKGLAVLADALPVVLRRHPRATVLLSLTSYGAGAAPLLDSLARAGLSNRVVVHGPGHVPQLHAAADLAVLPAPAGVGTASFPNVLLECMAGGVPIVATAVGGLPEVVQDGRTGALARPADAADLAERLSQLADDPVQRRRVASQARRLIESEFSWDAIAARMLGVYRGLVPGLAASEAPPPASPPTFPTSSAPPPPLPSPASSRPTLETR
jgi:glycosyltransferase involved in cell wall biosynthesis